MQAPVSNSKLSLGLFEADLETGELWKAGFRVKLQSQPFKVLAALLERPGQVVTREELQLRLWGRDTVVDFDGKSSSGTGFKFSACTDAALEAAIRRALLVYKDDKAFTALQRRAMRQDFSWRMPAQAYERVYRG